MAYTLNSNGTILSDGNKKLLKAANGIGEVILSEIFKKLKGEPFRKFELVYNPAQKVWLDSKRKYVIFNISNPEQTDIVEEYIKSTVEITVPTDAKVSNMDGALTISENLPITSNEGLAIDVPTQAKDRKSKLKTKLEE